MKLRSIQTLAGLSVFALSTLITVSSVSEGQTHAAGFRATIPAQPDKYGTFDVTIENVSKLTITAAHIFQNCKRPGSVSQTTVFDSLETFSFSSRQIQAGIDPGATRMFYVADVDPTCPKKVSVLFSDGHGEGSDDSLYGWQRMIADRYSLYDELVRTKKLVEAIDPQESDFVSTLLGALESRRSTLDDRDRRDVPGSEVFSREHVLDPLLMELRESADRMPTEVKTREAVIQVLERWMLLLRINGYDKPPMPKDSPTPNNSPSA